MKSKITIGFLAVAVLLCSSLVSAMDSRKIVLGNGFGFFGDNGPAGMVLDMADIFSNPAYLIDYPNILGMEGTGGTFFTGFTTIDMTMLGAPGVLGIQVGRKFGMLKTNTLTDTSDIDGLNGDIAGLTTVMVNTTVDGSSLTTLNGVQPYGIMYAIALSSDLKAGLAFNFVGNQLEGKNNSAVPTSADIKKTIGDMEIRLGADMKLGSTMTLSADAGLGLPSYNFTYDITGLSQKAEFSATNIDLNARFAMALSKTLDLVAMAGFATYGGDTEADPDTNVSADETTLTQTRTDLMVGVGALMKIDKGLAGIVLGMMNQNYAEEVKLATTSSKDNPSYFYFPSLRLLAEKKLVDWFTIRGSLAYVYQAQSTTVATGGGTEYTQTMPASSTMLALVGSTLDFNAFYLESVISQALLFNGPYIVGGVPTGLNLTLSLGYRF